MCVLSSTVEYRTDIAIESLRRGDGIITHLSHIPLLSVRVVRDAFALHPMGGKPTIQVDDNEPL